MTCLTLELDNRDQIRAALSGDVWIVACLCAAWCDVCRQFRPSFEALAAEHPDKRFIWVDIEDQADVVGDFDVENFPVLLLQRADTVAFFGTVLPDARQANRLLAAQVEKTLPELQQEAASNDQRRQWQLDYNLREKLEAAQAD
ncbi:thioredoxin family protein [Lacisediminimonas sp.]|uniref:thioredoxin family protein n=1 Tax=Lacisediminimonas sp. TaxID=3060582 RepID=UPI0027283981|nr:thioredoxin family protein [Lacisediminimonas sp.]MDO8299498.1 thioredoxin family protein [Lacisediminimonas sp.]MDO9216776.1 thioredoxin family protein [Lacisediminimonas sp.]